MHISSVTFRRQLSRFTSQVQEHSGRSFASFTEGLPAEWEDYKQEVRKEGLRLLDLGKWNCRDIGKGHLLERVIRSIEIHDHERELRNNLVRWDDRYGHKNRSHRALLDARSDALACRRFEEWFTDFFEDRIAEPEAFESFRELAGARYDLVAYLFFLKDWNRFMPIAPTTFDAAFKLLDLDLVTTKHCSWENYSRYNRVLLEIRDLLREIGDVPDARLIDAHSFCWMLVRLPRDAVAQEVVIRAPRFMGKPDLIAPRAEAAKLTEATTTFEQVDEEHFLRLEAERRRLGRLAQDIALISERRRLRDAGHANADEAVLAVWHEPNRGYDLLSCEIDGRPRHIEVKAARDAGGALSFFVTRNEWLKSRELENYYFYLVVGADSTSPDVLGIEGKDVPREWLEPMTYLATLRAR